jgi:quercetin dioxygenase-like cupin family protein
VVRIISSFVYAGNFHAVYLAENAGDELPPGLHKHDDYEHICVPMAGEIEVFFDDREPIAAKPGDQPFEFAPGRWHGIRAKTDGAMFMNVVRTVG